MSHTTISRRPSHPGLAFALAAALLCGACQDAAHDHGTSADDAPKVVTEAKVAVAGMHAINTTCPISGEAVTGAGGAVDLNGSLVGFCCKKCVAEFAKLDESGKVAALAQHGTTVPK